MQKTLPHRPEPNGYSDAAERFKGVRPFFTPGVIALFDRPRSTERLASSELLIATPPARAQSCLARSNCRRQFNSIKENVMNDEMELELEIVDLGDAKEETKGLKIGFNFEDNPVLLYRDPA